MAEPKDDVQNFLDQVDKKINEYLTPFASKPDNNEAFSNASDTPKNPDSPEEQESSTSSGSSERSESQNDDAAPASPETPPRPRQPFIPGISSAYADINTDNLSNGDGAKTSQKVLSNKSSIKPPERKRGGAKAGGGKDIMEMFWNECIIAPYENLINFVVDTSLDFCEWVLFTPFQSSGATVETKTTPEPKSKYAMGDEVFAERSKELDIAKDKMQELKNNIQAEERGIMPRWQKWGEMPDFYPKLKKISEIARNDPNSREAELLEKIGFTDNEEAMSAKKVKAKLLFKIAVGLATLEDIVNPARSLMPEALNVKMGELEQLAGQNNSDVNVVKTTAKEKLDVMINAVPGENEIYKSMRQALNELKNHMEAENDPVVLNKKLKQGLKQIKSISLTATDNEELIKRRIVTQAQGKYDNLKENIDKIYEAKSANPEELKETVKNYLNAVIKEHKTAKSDADEFLRKKGKSQLKKAQDAVKKANNSIDDFLLDNIKLADKPEASLKEPAVLTEKQTIEIIKNHNLSR